MKNIFILFLITIMTSISLPLPLYAGTPDGQPNIPKSKKILKKLSRGIVNVITGPGEIIKHSILEAEESETVVGVSAGCLTGFFVGVGWMFYRVGTGLFDIFTFPININNYESLIEPEFLI